MARRFARYKRLKELGYFDNRTSLARAIQAGFPAAYELGPNTVAWDLDEVEAWFDSRPRRTPKIPDTASPQN
jgi:predicted DNA-binding transcriptional regulator AlpA